MPITDANGVVKFVGQVAYVAYGYRPDPTVAVIKTDDGFQFHVVQAGEVFQCDTREPDLYYAGRDALASVQKFCRRVMGCRREASRTAQLYPGDTVLVNDDCTEEDYAGCRLTYVGPGVLKDKYGNVCEVPANEYRKVGNGPRTPKSELTGTTAFELLKLIDLNNVDHVLVCQAIDELYSEGKLSDADVTNLMQWGSNGYTNLLG